MARDSGFMELRPQSFKALFARPLLTQSGQQRDARRAPQSGDDLTPAVRRGASAHGGPAAYARPDLAAAGNRHASDLAADFGSRAVRSLGSYLSDIEKILSDEGVDPAEFRRQVAGQVDAFSKQAAGGTGQSETDESGAAFSLSRSISVEAAQSESGSQFHAAISESAQFSFAGSFHTKTGETISVEASFSIELAAEVSYSETLSAPGGEPDSQAAGAQDQSLQPLQGAPADGFLKAVEGLFAKLDKLRIERRKRDDNDTKEAATDEGSKKTTTDGTGSNASSLLFSFELERSTFHEEASFAHFSDAARSGTVSQYQSVAQYERQSLLASAAIA